MKCVKKIISIVYLLIVPLTILSAQNIHKVVKQGDIQEVKNLLEENPDIINAKDDVGRTALHLACIEPSTEIIELLINNGADVNALDNNTIAPLHSLAITENVGSAKYLIKNGATIDIKDNADQTPLHLASRIGNTIMAQLFVENGADIEAVTAYGRTPFLIMARESGDYNLANYLLSAGADVNAADRSGNTALTLSAWRGFRETNDLIIEKGAIPPAQGWKLQWTMQNAVEKRLDNLFELLVKNDFDLNLEMGGNTCLLHYAASGGSVKIIQLLLDEGLDINAKDINHWTPIHYAVEKGRSEAIRLLLEKGANINARTYLGESAYNVAKEYKYEEGNPTKLLIEYNADTSSAQFPKLAGKYMGQSNPTSAPVMFAPGITTGHYTHHSTPVFSIDGNEAYWSIQVAPRDKGYGTSYVVYSKIEDGYWTKPTRAPFNIEYRADVPFFHPNGKQLFYISRGPLKKGEEGGKENIWTLDKLNNEWVNPKPLGQNINSLDMHWQFSMDKNGNLYFNDNYAKLANGKYEKPIKIKEALGNNTLEVDQPFISSEGDYMIYTTFLDNGNGVDLFVSFKKPNGTWSDGINLGDEINTTGHEICPIISNDNKVLFFQRNNYPFWVDAGFIQNLRPVE